MDPLRIELLDDDLAVVVLVGKQDISTEWRLSTALRSLVEEGRSLVIDLSEVEFLDSSVVNNVLQAYRLMEDGAALVLQLDTSAATHKLLELTGVLALLPAGQTRDQAVRAARAARRRDRYLAGGS